MLDNENYNHCGRVAKLLNKLRQLLKVINHDEVVHAATEYCETTYALRQTLKTIPKTKNSKLRKASARAALQEMEYHLELGVDHSRPICL